MQKWNRAEFDQALDRAITLLPSIAAQSAEKKRGGYLIGDTLREVGFNVTEGALDWLLRLDPIYAVIRLHVRGKPAGKDPEPTMRNTAWEHYVQAA